MKKFFRCESSLLIYVPGRIGIVGGSYAYCGAPYYAGISVLRAGSDLSFVFCTQDAALPIKSYSPELIVVPSLTGDAVQLSKALESLQRLHAIVVGPGLGRDEEVMGNARKFIQAAMKHNLGIVLDGDALFMLTVMPDLVQAIKGYPSLVLTPNKMEMQRLFTAVMKGEEYKGSSTNTHEHFQSANLTKGAVVSGNCC